MEGKFDGTYMNHHPKNMINGMNKIRERDNPTKRAGPREQGMVKTQLEIVEVKNPHSILTYEVCIVH